MNRNSRKVIVQAPLGVPLGVACAVMAGFPESLLALQDWPVPMLQGGLQARQPRFSQMPAVQLPAGATGARHNRITIAARRD
jgi:hypothetical protein